jgi:hypothetical protein
MTQTKRGLAFTLLLAFASLQCVTPAGTPSTGNEELGELSALIDGQPFSVKSIRNDRGTVSGAFACLYGEPTYNLVVYADSPSGTTLWISIDDNVTGVGTYTLSAPDDGSYGTYYFAGKQFWTDNQVGGMLSISSFDTMRRTIDATFSFTAISQDSQRVLISQGKVRKVPLVHCMPNVTSSAVQNF